MRKLTEKEKEASRKRQREIFHNGAGKINPVEDVSKWWSKASPIMAKELIKIDQDQMRSALAARKKKVR